MYQENTPRFTALQQWIHSLNETQIFKLNINSIAPASADASFRRYFRIEMNEHQDVESHTSFIIMDAPPQHEDCTQFITISELFSNANVNTPKILAKNLEQGFLLLSDLGNETYLSNLTVLQQKWIDAQKEVNLTHEFTNAITKNVEKSIQNLYEKGIDELILIQKASQKGVLPSYDATLLKKEMDLFPDWYCAKHLEKPLNEGQMNQFNIIASLLVMNAQSQPQVFVHRDFHARNLMMPLAKNQDKAGVLDFQDGVYGANTYDLVSLFKDAYISWDEEFILDQLAKYWEKAKQAGLPLQNDFAQFYQDFEWMGLQRHLKVLGIFARLYHRDGKSGYLKDMPLVMQYTKKVCERYAVFHPLLNLLNELEGIDLETQVGYTF